MRAVAAITLASQDAITVKLGVAAGAWNTLAEASGSGSSSSGRGNVAVSFSPAHEDGNAVVVTVAHNVDDKDIRVVAVDTGDKEIRPGRSMTGGAGNVHQLTCTFYGMRLNNVKEFHLQSRPYEWATFKNVALRPAVAGPWTGEPKMPSPLPVGQSATFTLKPLAGEINTSWPCINLDTGRESTLGQSIALSTGSLSATRIQGQTQSLIFITDRAKLREMPKGQDTSVLWDVPDAEAALALATEPGTFFYPQRPAPYVLAYKTKSGRVGLIKVEAVSPEQSQLTIKLLDAQAITQAASPTTKNASNGAKRLVAERDIVAMSAALAAFKSDAGRYPTTSEGLVALVEKPAGIHEWKGPYFRMPLGRKSGDDPWGRPYIYRCPCQHNRDGFDLLSIGPDGREGTDDDIANWALSASQPVAEPDQ